MSRNWTLVLLTVVLLVISGCQPRQEGPDQCPDINVSTTAKKDEQYAVGSMPLVDTRMSQFLGESGAPGCAVGIMENNQISYLKGYGFADLGTIGMGGDETPFTEATPSLVGSISKTLTALTVLRLEELNFLDIDDPITDYLPLNNLAGVTIRDLLAHTTGLQRGPTFWGGLDEESELEAVFPGVEHPGIHPRLVYWAYQSITPVDPIPAQIDGFYSNTGYMLLGAIVDYVITNNQLWFPKTDAYESFLWQQVGMFDDGGLGAEKSISLCLNEDWRQSDIENLATGYLLTGNGYVERGQTDLSGPLGWEGPPGGWTMTIGDLTRLMIAIQENSIVSETTRDEMLCLQGTNDVGPYGLGTFLLTKSNRRVYAHGGAYPGFAARYIVWPNSDFGIAVMCNHDGPAGTTNALTGLTDDIASFFLSPGSTAGWPDCQDGGGGAGGGGGADGGGDPVELPDPPLQVTIGSQAPVSIPSAHQQELLDALLDPTVTCDGLAVTILGTDGNDTITGSSGDDVIHGLRGDDVIDGAGGNDTICGGTGSDTLIGGGGDDFLFDDSGINDLQGGGGNDTLIVLGLRNTLDGGTGDDFVGVQGDSNTLDGGAGDDTLGAAGDDNGVFGGLGRDIVGNLGNDNLVCGDPKRHGYWHRQCLGLPAAEGGIDPGRTGRGVSPPGEPAFAALRLDCATNRLGSLGFSALTACDGLSASPPSDACQRAERQMTSLVLNVCSGRVSDGCPIDVAAQGCLSTTVGDVLVEVSGLLATGGCDLARACVAAINESDGLGHAGGEQPVTGGPAPGLRRTERSLSESPRPGFRSK